MLYVHNTVFQRINLVKINTDAATFYETDSTRGCDSSSNVIGSNDDFIIIIIKDADAPLE